MIRRGVFCCIGGVAAVLVLLAFGVARSWPPEIQNGPAAPPAGFPAAAGSFRLGGAPSDVPASPEPGRFTQMMHAPAPPKAKTIDDLIAALNAIQAKKAELEKAEKETMTQLREALQMQKHQLQKLGVKVADGAEQTGESATSNLPSGTAPGRMSVLGKD